MGITDLKGKPLSQEEYERRSNEVLSNGGVMFDIHGAQATLSLSEEAYQKVKADADRQGKTVEELIQTTWQAQVEQAMKKHGKKKKP